MIWCASNRPNKTKCYPYFWSVHLLLQTMLETPKSALNMRHLIRSIVQACSIRMYTCVFFSFVLICLILSREALVTKIWLRDPNELQILGPFWPKRETVHSLFLLRYVHHFSRLVIIYLCRRSSRFAIAHFSGWECEFTNYLFTGPSRYDLYIPIYYNILYIRKTRQRCNKGSVRYQVSLPCPCVEYDQLKFFKRCLRSICSIQFLSWICLATAWWTENVCFLLPCSNKLVVTEAGTWADSVAKLTLACWQHGKIRDVVPYSSASIACLAI